MAPPVSVRADFGTLLAHLGKHHIFPGVSTCKHLLSRGVGPHCVNTTVSCANSGYVPLSCFNGSNFRRAVRGTVRTVRLPAASASRWHTVYLPAASASSRLTHTLSYRLEID
eukprot:7239834-Prymnesium_polylepis.1